MHAPTAPNLPDWPEYGLTDDLLPTLERWQNAGHRVALATLIAVEGSSPRPIGSEMAVSDTGEIAGYVSGGCVEAAIATEARTCFSDARPRLLDYGAGSPAMDIQLSCGGRITVLLRLVPDLKTYLAHHIQARATRQTLYITTNLHTGETTCTIDRPLPTPDTFTRTHEPPVRLIVAGRDPVTLALLALSRNIGIQTRLLSPLGPTDPPPGHDPTQYDRRPLDRALSDLHPDRRTAVYALSHDAHIDLALAEYALKSDAFCVGILGSRNKSAGRRDTLRRRGVPESAFQRLHLPAGLNIGARNPSEIALAIIAQITATRP